MARPLRRRGPARTLLLVVGVVVGLGLGLGLTGCGSDAPLKTTDDGKITVTGSGPKARVTIKGENTDLTFNQQKLPQGFPSVVPLPKGWKWVGATSGTAAGRALFQITYSIGDEAAPKAIAAYQEQLTSNGFTLDPPPAGIITDDGITEMNTTGNGWRVSAASVAGPTPHTVVVSVQPEAPGRDRQAG